MARVGDKGVEVRMSEVPNSGNDLRYEARFPYPASNQRVVVSFLRAPNRANAGLSEVWLAGDFDITNTPGTLRPGAAAAMMVNNAAPQKVDVVGDCINGAGGRITLGTYNTSTYLALDTNKLLLKPGTTGCNAWLDVRRETTGRVDSAFKRGVFDSVHEMEGVQARSAGVYVSK